MKVGGGVFAVTEPVNQLWVSQSRDEKATAAPRDYTAVPRPSLARKRNGSRSEQHLTRKVLAESLNAGARLESDGCVESCCLDIECDARDIIKSLS